MEPAAENIPLGELRLLDETKGETIGTLFENTVNLKDLWCATRFFVDPSNEALIKKYRLENGLCRYRPPYQKNREKFPFYKAKYMTAFLYDRTPQAVNPEYGVRLILDLINERKLKVAKGVTMFTKILRECHVGHRKRIAVVRPSGRDTWAAKIFLWKQLR